MVVQWLALGLLYVGAAYSFYTYLIKTARVLPKEMEEPTCPRGPYPESAKPERRPEVSDFAVAHVRRSLP